MWFVVVVVVVVVVVFNASLFSSRNVMRNNMGICNESTLPLLAIKLTGLVFEKSGRKFFRT